MGIPQRSCERLVTLYHLGYCLKILQAFCISSGGTVAQLVSSNATDAAKIIFFIMSPHILAHRELCLILELFLPQLNLLPTKSRDHPPSLLDDVVNLQISYSYRPDQS